MELLLRRRGVRDGGDELTHHPLLRVTRRAGDREVARGGGISGVGGVRLGYPTGNDGVRLGVGRDGGRRREIRRGGGLLRLESRRRRVLVVGGGRRGMLGGGHRELGGGGGRVEMLRHGGSRSVNAAILGDVVRKEERRVHRLVRGAPWEAKIHG